MPAIAFPKQPTSDLYGDPLPDGAIARLGTIRLRAGCSSLVFSADGKRLIGVEGRLVREWDASDGRLLRAIRLADDARTQSSHSGDGRTLVLGTKWALEMWDVPSGKPIDLPLPPLKGALCMFAVSNDRRWLMEAHFSRQINDTSVDLFLWDTAKRTSRKLGRVEMTLVNLRFSPDSKRCLCTGSPGAMVWDTTSGKLLWQVQKCNALGPHFTPDGKYVIAEPRWSNGRWHIWNAETGAEVRDLHPPTGAASDFDVSPNGSMLLLAEKKDYVLWDMKSGRERRRWPGASESGVGLFAPNGRSVVVFDAVRRRWDLATGKNLYPDVTPFGHTAAVRHIFFSYDGKLLVSIADDNTARVWDVRTSRLMRTVALGVKGVDAWTVSADARRLYGVDGQLTLHRWPLDSAHPPTSVQLRDARELDIDLKAREIRIAPDDSLAMLAWPRLAECAFNQYSFSFWNPWTGRLVRWGGEPGPEYRGDSTRLSPDCNLAGAADAVFSMCTGKRQTIPQSPIGAPRVAAISSDGKLVAACGVAARVSEVATGRSLVDLPPRAYGGDQAAFSPDGRRLACFSNYKLVVWDVLSRRALSERPVPPEFAEDADWLTGGLAFSPDGTVLASGHADGTILLWSAPPPKPEAHWNDADGAALINDLGDATPANAYPAVWQMIAQPADAVRMLKNRYRLVDPITPSEQKKLIAELDSPRFRERELASKRLIELGRAAGTPLRQALKDDVSPEQRRRIEAVLAVLDPPPGPPRGEDLRAIRAVAVLEACATQDARRLLNEWAERAARPRVAAEAARAVERLKVRR